MTDNNTLNDKNIDSQNQQVRKINIRMKQFDNSIQPTYSNVTLVSGNKDFVMLDFGYLDNQLIASLNRMLKAGENIPNIIDAKMTCRLALNSDTASQLIKQLNNILEPQQVIEGEPKVEQAALVPEKELESSSEVVEPLDQASGKSLHSGFKFPWLN